MDFFGVPAEACILDGFFECGKEIIGEGEGRGEGEIVGVAGIIDGCVLLLEEGKEALVECAGGEIEEVARGGRALGELVFVGNERGEEVDDAFADLKGAAQAEFLEHGTEVLLEDQFDAVGGDGGEGIFEVDIDQMLSVEVSLSVGDDGASGDKAV